MALTAADVKARALDIGFDLCGIAAPGDYRELRYLDEWIARGYAGEMRYMARSARRRADVRHVLPSARSVISLGTVYNTDRPYSTEVDDRDEALISRYAWGADYHAVLERRCQALLAWMRASGPEALDARVYVDTGPVQERVYAQYAGLGWIGKNTCLIHPELGSWLFLSEILCSLPFEPDAPALDQCGTCTLCLDACPTGALPAPWVLDATRCLSYLTIELKGDLPEEHRADVGTRVYGCDVCQDVCPYNASPAHSADPAWLPVSAFDAPRLSVLWETPDDALAGILDQSAMSRAGVRGLRRNLAVALGNSATPAAQRALDRETEPISDSREDPLVARHITWARERLAARGKNPRRTETPPGESRVRPLQGARRKITSRM